MSVPENVIVLGTTPLNENGEFAQLQGEGPTSLYLGGHTRMEAAARLAQDNPDTLFVPVGGFNTDGDLLASDKVAGMERFLKQKVPHVQVRGVESLPCTQHNFVAVFQSLDLPAGSTVGILTNEYHGDRALAFARLAAERLDRASDIGFVVLGAETILGYDDPISALAKEDHPAYYRRLLSEAQGLRQITDGSYADSCLTTKFERLQTVIRAFPNLLLTPAERRALEL